MEGIGRERSYGAGSWNEGLHKIKAHERHFTCWRQEGSAHGVTMRERAKLQQNINRILIRSKAKRGIRFVTFKRQVPQSRQRLRCVQRRVRSQYTRKEVQNLNNQRSSPVFSTLVKLPIRTHDSLAACHVALSEKTFLLRPKCAHNSVGDTLVVEQNKITLNPVV